MLPQRTDDQKIALNLFEISNLGTEIPKCKVNIVREEWRNGVLELEPLGEDADGVSLLAPFPGLLCACTPALPPSNDPRPEAGATLGGGPGTGDGLPGLAGGRRGGREGSIDGRPLLLVRVLCHGPRLGEDDGRWPGLPLPPPPPSASAAAPHRPTLRPNLA